MNDKSNFRRQIVDELIPYFRKDPRYRLLVCDMGFGVIDNFCKEFPERIINCGIMEQGTVGIASGMSMSGLIPIVYSIVNFLVFRAVEQIRNDIVLQNLNVKFISTGVDNYFKFLGPSHSCNKDDIAIMELISLKVYDPYLGNKPFRDLLQEWILDDKAGYLRV